MPTPTKAPAVHIAPEHQSSPKEHWADKEVAKAAEEIRSGQFTPTLDEDDFLAVGIQRGVNIKNPNELGPGKLALIQETTDSLILAQHPRVQEALIRLEQENAKPELPKKRLKNLRCSMR